jgi:FkbM family methyltransferase
LADRLGVNERESRIAFEDRVVLKYKHFMRVSGQLHIWNDQLGILMQYGAWRLRQLKPSYDADLYFVKTKTNPSFIVAPLHPLKDTHVSTDLLKVGAWEESTSALVAWSLQSYINADSTEPCVLIDVGANIGWFSLLGAALGCQSIAFEPVAEHCQQIRLGFAASGLPESQLILHQSGALSTTTKVAVNKFDIGPAATSYVTPADNTDDKRSGIESTISVRVDEVVLKHLESTSGNTCSAQGCESSNLSRVRAIKIDAEGCELEAFVSAEAILRPFADAYNSSLKPPDVFVELCPDMLARCPGDWKQTLQQSAEIFEALYPQRLYVYHFHGHRLERSWATGLEPSHQYPSDIPWKDWGVDPKYTKQGVHELRVDASGFVEYVEVLAKEAKGCFYLWAVSGRELEPI